MKNNSEENRYIQSARLSGQPYNATWLSYKAIMAGGVLEFAMGAEPNHAFGATPAPASS